MAKRDLVTKRDVDGVITAPRAYPQCDWISNGERCKYPGSMTHSTMAYPEIAWFCSAHFGCEDPIVGADITAASQDFVWIAPKDRR